MKVSKDWNAIRAIHSYITKTPPIIADLIATIDVIRLCASGLSNESIASILELDKEYVSNVITMWFIVFDGWDRNLPVNSYKFYLMSGSNYDVFRSKVGSKLDSDDTVIAWTTSVMYDYLRKEKDKYERD